MTPAAFRLARNRRRSRTLAGAGRVGGEGGGAVRSDYIQPLSARLTNAPSVTTR